MLYTLLNKEVPVCDVDCNNNFGTWNVTKVYNHEYRPFRVKLTEADKTGISLIFWWNNRVIPETRKDFQRILVDSGFSSASDYAFANLGLSLSDQYWIRPIERTDLVWRNVNFFQNDFVFDMDILETTSSGRQKSLTPNATSNGNLPKKWIIRDSVRLLYKGASDPFRQEPYNECVASRLLDAMKIKHVPYTFDHGFSVCPCFIDENTEFVPAWNVFNTELMEKNENEYTYLMRVCDQYGISCRRDVQNMLAFDFLIVNGDRHYNNFGFIRDVNTLKFKGMAPIFDNGCSMWFNKLNEDIGFPVKAHPFFPDFAEQLALVCDKELISDNVQVRDIVLDTFSELNFNAERAERIANVIERRTHALKRCQEKKIHKQSLKVSSYKT